MAISRSLMNRQLQADGGIMQVTPRENFGLGSKLKKFARKIIPNEVADIAVKAAPFVAPFNPALAGAMAGIGTFDQTGSIGDSLKSGALTYGGGQAARYIGGAGFQGNPFASGGAFTPSGFTSGFSSPIGSDTGLGKFFSNRGTEAVQGVQVGDEFPVDDLGSDRFSDKLISKTDVDLGSDTFSDNMVFKNTPEKLKEKVTEQVVASTGSPKQMTITESIQKILSPNSTLTERGTETLNLLKRTGKAAFTKPDGKGGTTIDKPAVLGALAFTASYAEAKALAAETGIDEDLTEAEYDELTKAEKKDEYAGYLTNFFAGKKDGGRIGFKFGSEPEEAEIGIMAIDVEAGDDEDNIDDLMAGITFSSAEKSYLFRRLAGGGGSSRSYTMPNLYRILSNPNRYPSDAAILKEIAVMGLGKKDGGRIGFAEGTSDKELEEILATDMTISNNPNDPRNMTTEEIIAVINSGRSTPELFEELLLRDYTGVDSIMLDEIGGKKLDAPQQAYSFRPDGESGVIEDFLFKLRESNPDIYGDYNRPRKFLPTAEPRADGGRIGFAGGSGSSNRIAQLILERDYLLSKDEDVSYIDAELASLGYKMKSEGGVMDVKIPTGQIRKNNAGVIERDYRDEGGFVPVGIKERADDVPAMLSKNEFVMTADAVRGIGGGDVEKGSKKLYNTMKQAEKVGKA